MKRSKSYSRKKCPKGSISRRSYNYKRKSTGKRVKVRSSCVKSKGRRSRGLRVNRVLPSLKKGSLTKYGYHLSDSKDERHKALKKAFDAYGYSTLIKKLNAVRLYNKSKPSVYNKYTQDMNYVHKLNE
jgi:Family of unknown function (DUF5771)